LLALAANVSEAGRLAQAAADANNPALTGEIEAVGKAWRDHQAETERLLRERRAEAARLSAGCGAIGL
jgi:hypothetical protein